MNVDIAIVGGGATGVALALGLAKETTHKVVLLDAGEPPQAHTISQGFDQRTVALSQSSIERLWALDISLQNLTTSPIQHIHVSDHTHAGQVRLSAEQHQVEAFGYVLPLSALGAQIYQDFEQLKQSTVDYCPSTTVQSVARSTNASELKLHDSSTINAKLVVLADGGRSSLAEQFGLTRSETDYHQTALTFVLSTSSPHNGWAYERFTQNGPLAFLPLTANEFGVVWTVSSTQADELLALSNVEFTQRLQQLFGYRQGLITKVSNIESYPLMLKQLDSVFSEGVVAIGNAAQTLHPIAGQGVNLGFRDVGALIETLARIDSANVGQYEVLSQYKGLREADRNATIGLTDGLVRAFSNDYLPLVMGRNIALSGLNLCSIAKQSFANQAMGYTHAAL